jgi:hypothetical protein
MHAPLVFIGDFEPHGYLRGGAKHGRHTAVFGLGKFDGVLDGFRVNAVTPNKMDDFDVSVYAGMFRSPLATHFNAIAGNSLSLLFQNGHYIRAGTAPKRDEQQFHW